MDNQHQKIKGYRDFDQATIDLINEFKEKERELLDIVDELIDNDGCDVRWMAIARTDIQKGFMSAIRAVAKPEE